jgi:hypothetical protein
LGAVVNVWHTIAGDVALKTPTVGPFAPPFKREVIVSRVHACLEPTNDINRYDYQIARAHQYNRQSSSGSGTFDDSEGTGTIAQATNTKRGFNVPGCACKQMEEKLASRDLHAGKCRSACNPQTFTEFGSACIMQAMLMTTQHRWTGIIKQVSSIQQTECLRF